MIFMISVHILKDTKASTISLTTVTFLRLDPLRTSLANAGMSPTQHVQVWLMISNTTAAATPTAAHATLELHLTSGLPCHLHYQNNVWSDLQTNNVNI